MNPDDAFLATILEDPDDDTPRLIYADWLDDRGQTDRAEFIRLQCEIARLPEDDDRLPPLQEIERRLLERCQDQWLGPLRPLFSGWTFRRGFLDAVRVPAATYLRHPAFPRPATVRRVEVDLEGFEVPADALQLVPEPVAYANVLLPIGLRGGTLLLALQDPPEADILGKMRVVFNRDIEAVVAPGRQVAEAIRRHFGDPVVEGDEPDLLGWIASPPTVSPDEVNFGTRDDLVTWDNGSPAARLLTRLVAAAVGLNAGEVGVEPASDRILVRCTTADGTSAGTVTPVQLLWPLVARLRIMAGIWIDDVREVQAGAFGMTVRGRRIDMGVVVHRRADGPAVVLTFRPPDSGIG
jgi:uncharacterized protein (TIGR02996 family)